MKNNTLTFGLVTLLAGFWPAFGHKAANCKNNEIFQKLDFWVGEWEVYTDSQQVGTNTIKKILNGCAILEHWTGTRGEQGKSLFYYDPSERYWKQVWVTVNPLRPGGTKEKHMITEFQNLSVV